MNADLVDFTPESYLILPFFFFQTPQAGADTDRLLFRGQFLLFKFAQCQMAVNAEDGLKQLNCRTVLSRQLLLSKL